MTICAPLRSTFCAGTLTRTNVCLVSVGEVLQSLEVSEATLSRWRSQYGGMKSEEAKRLKQLEEENNRLKQIVGDQALDIQMLKEINRGN